MYAQLKDGQLVNSTNGNTMIWEDGRTSFNPTSSQMNEHGYYEVPPVTATVSGWSLTDGTLVPSYAPAHEETRPDSWTVSRYGICVQAMKLGVMDKLMAFVNADATIAFLWSSVNDIDTANEQFISAKPKILTALGITEPQLEDALWAARAY
jgi:hypothetical protein